MHTGNEVICKIWRVDRQGQTCLSKAVFFAATSSCISVALCRPYATTRSMRRVIKASPASWRMLPEIRIATPYCLHIDSSRAVRFTCKDAPLQISQQKKGYKFYECDDVSGGEMQESRQLSSSLWAEQVLSGRDVISRRAAACILPVLWRFGFIWKIMWPRSMCKAKDIDWQTTGHHAWVSQQTLRQLSVNEGYVGTGAGNKHLGFGWATGGKS